jgi:hypothetical protein
MQSYRCRFGGEKLRAHIGLRGGIAIALFAATRNLRSANEAGGRVTPALSGLISTPLSSRSADRQIENIEEVV